MISCNCKDCPDRSIEPNCHTTCESYLKYTKYLDEQRNKIKKARAQGNVSTISKNKALKKKIKK